MKDPKDIESFISEQKQRLREQPECASALYNLGVAFMNQGKIVALDTPLNLKQQYGKRALKAKVSTESGDLEDREVALDTPETPNAIQQLFAEENVVTVHSEEATLEDIFISITGRGLHE